MSTRAITRIEFGTYAMWLALACLIALTMSACAPKSYPTARPKYGDSTRPIGPDKSHFKPSQPKFQ